MIVNIVDHGRHYTFDIIHGERRIPVTYIKTRKNHGQKTC